MNEIAQAHAAVGGTGPGRRYATQQINQAYAVLLASQFQGFCRDLHTESADYLMTTIAPPLAIRRLIQAEFNRGRQLDRGNAQPGSIGADFGRLGIDLWPAMQNYDPRNVARKVALDVLNNWRNAIVHQDFDPAKLGGTATLQLAQVRKWRVTCQGLARALDEVLRRHLQVLTGSTPW